MIDEMMEKIRERKESESESFVDPLSYLSTEEKSALINYQSAALHEIKERNREISKRIFMA